MEKFNFLTRNRRSVRRYKKEPISNEDLEKILNSVRYAPTGGNSQELEYLIITDPIRLSQIRDEMAKKFRLLKRLLRAFYGLVRLVVGKEQAIQFKVSIRRFMEKYESKNEAGGEEDPFLRTAPTLMIIYIGWSRSNRPKCSISQFDFWARTRPKIEL